jgi:hypothetical protein
MQCPDCGQLRHAGDCETQDTEFHAGPSAVPATLSRMAEEPGHLPNQPHLAGETGPIEGCNCVCCKTNMRYEP